MPHSVSFLSAIGTRREQELSGSSFCFASGVLQGELRGGSWVVVDSRLNSEYMEMYADVESRGGVMEPSGTVEIKFRDKMLVETMKRLDRVIRQLEKVRSPPTWFACISLGTCVSRQVVLERTE